MVFRRLSFVDYLVRQVEYVDPHASDIRSEFLPVQDFLHDTGQFVVNVPWKETSGSSRIGNQFLLIKFLCDFKRFSGSHSVIVVGVFLEFGQVVEGWRLYLPDLSADSGDACMSGQFAVTVKPCSRLPVREFFRTAHFEQGVIFAQADKNRKGVRGNVVLTFTVTAAYGCQYGCLHPSQ